MLLTTQYLEEADRLADAVVIIDGGRIVASGTPDDLKARIGGDRLEVVAVPGDDPNRLARTLEGLGSGPVSLQPGGRVVVPVAQRADVLSVLPALLADGGTRISELSLRRPSLDDVFLSLTGHARDPEAADADARPTRRASA